MGLIEGGTAVLFAIVVYGIFYGLAGSQVRNIIIADEAPAARVFGFLAAAFVALLVWGVVGGVVYWGILIWFRIWLREPQPWRQQILSMTGWFPFGLLFKRLPLPAGGARLALVLLGFPFALLVAAGGISIGLRVRDAIARAVRARRQVSARGLTASRRGVR